MAETLFGLIGSLDPTILLAVFIGLILLLIVFETLLHLLEEFAIDSGYEDLVRRLYKEMMMMGYLSFGVFLAFNAAGLRHDQQYLAFEFSHITTFFIAIFFVVRACLFVQYTRTSKQYFQAVHNESIQSLMTRFQEMTTQPWSRQSFLYKYFPSVSSLRRSIEYHILKAYFFKTYRLIPSQFRYVNYLSKNYKFYVIELTEIRPICWFVPIVLILINYLRVQVIGDLGMSLACDNPPHHYSSNSSSYDDDHHRALSSSGDDVSYHVSHSCEDYLLPYALFCSSLLVLFGCVMILLTIHSKNKLLVVAGVKTEEDILTSLRNLLLEEQYALRISNSEPTVEPTGLPTSLLQTSALNFRQDKSGMTRQSSLFSFGKAFQEQYQVCTLRVMLHIHLERQEAKEHQWIHTFHRLLRKLSECCHCNFHSGPQEKLTPMLDRVNSLRMKAQREREGEAQEEEGNNEGICGSETEETEGTAAAEAEGREERGPRAVRGLSNAHSDGEKDLEMQITTPTQHSGILHQPLPAHGQSEDQEFIDASKHPLAHELHSIFPFSSRDLYEFLIQELLLLDSLFLALWATNFITMSLHSHHKISFNLLFLLPIFLMLFINFLILFLSSTLFALTSLKNKGSEWICEQDDICQKVLPHLRREILNLLPNGAYDKRIVELYQLVAGTTVKKNRQTKKCQQSNSISREGFAQLLHILGMHPSEKEIRALFRSMDKDDSGSIELSELKELLLDPDVAGVKSPKPHRSRT